MSVASPSSPPPVSSSGRAFWSKLDVKSAPYLYIAPFFILFALVGLFPLLYTAFVSVHKWGLITGNQGFIGLKNFQDVLSQPRFWQGMRNTFSIFLLSSVPQVIMAVFIAAVLDANLRAKTFWRMGVLVPYVVAPVAVGLIFNQMFADQSGLVNAALTSLGLPTIGWHAESWAAHVAIATMVNFRWTGYNTLIVLAAMQAIPRDVIEAAVVDGASRIHTFFSVTIPMLRPTLIFVIITSTIGGLQIFDEPRMFDQIGLGGNDRQWMTITMFMYEVGWGSQRNFGRAAAVAWILFIVIVAFALINYWLTSRIANSGGAAPRGRKAKKGGAR
ncbi:carbohydrate ABC transporter permease [Tessaracoccus caeni]|uniref:carbohydrate ABC transporter permease n=1 Tax=Tessaracoccus caeni TaxID=3031239 RepID=UPI0023DA5D6D|nr:sugar ABC transporter permease [Tessaracoccus caeni]MDF1489146.1 sugar ABC transporter permease [Tessaracoccus caeni]